MKIFLLSLIFLCTVFPSLVSAQEFFGPLVPACSGGECQMCHLIQLGNNIIRFLISIFAVIGAILIAVGGFYMVTSAGNVSRRDKGKGILTNTVIGLIIMLVAWLVVDTVMKTLAGSKAYGMWREIQCVALPEYDDWAELVSPDAEPIPDNEIEPLPQLVVNPDYTFSYQSGIRSQASHASQELNLLLSCMASKVEPDVGQISSISDSYIVNGSKTWQQCAGGQCQHAAQSCHYGGKSCTGRSYAVDFGDEWNANGLAAAARACGADFIGNEGDHLHVSVGRECGCK